MASWQRARQLGWLAPAPPGEVPLTVEVLLADSAGELVRVHAGGQSADEAVALAEREISRRLTSDLRPNRLEGRMNGPRIHRLPGSQTPTRLQASALASQAELARLSVSELEQLRRALAHALGQVELGSPPSRAADADY